MRKLLSRFHRNKEGASATEYIMVLVLVAVALLLVWKRFGETLKDKLAMAEDEVAAELVEPSE